MSATTAAKIGRSMKNARTCGARPAYCVDAMSTRRAWSSLPLPVTSDRRHELDAPRRRRPSATSSSRTACARFFASSTLAAALPVLSA